ncbi:MAG: hypothetical protein AB1453_07235 [Chloroflexota bacterium]|jgi:hypothetical protein
MSNSTNWIAARVRLGWIMLAAGLLTGFTGAWAPAQFAGLPFNFRIITGVGIFLVGMGAANIVRYRAALKDERSARRITIEEHDERSLLIRHRAGYRAFWAAFVLVYSGLMWVSFAADGSLPEMSADALWYFLAASALIPMGVYILSMVVDERNL